MLPYTDTGNPTQSRAYARADRADATAPSSADIQAPSIDTALACLVIIAHFHGMAVDKDQLAHEFSPAGLLFGSADILLAAKSLDFKASLVKVASQRLDKIPLPAIAVMTDGRGEPAYCILARIEAGSDEMQLLIHCPVSGQPEALTLEQFTTRWNGEMILFASRASMAGTLARFDFTWFIPAVVKYRRLLCQVLLVSLVLQMFALVTPLFF